MGITMLSEKCNICEGQLYHWVEEDQGLVLVACYDCGAVEDKGSDPAALAHWLKGMTEDAEVDTENLTQAEAYKLNKERDKCVVCGKKLAMHPSVSVKYCKCIEQLP